MTKNKYRVLVRSNGEPSGMAQPAPAPVPTPAPAPAQQPKSLIDQLLGPINKFFNPQPAPAQPAAPVAMQAAAAPSEPRNAFDQGVETVGNIGDQINDPISNLVNGLTGMVNKFAAVLGPQPPLETDPTGIIEAASEGWTVLDDSFRALYANVQSFLQLDPSVARELIKIGEKGDEICDAERGDVRMTIELPLTPGYPFHSLRQFNACIDTKTARTVVKQLTSDPMKPVMNALECSLSEMLLKPVDQITRDVKNGIAHGTRFRLKEGFQNFIDFSEKVWSGSYRVQLNPDAITCFQAKTNNVPFKTVSGNQLMTDLTDLRFLSGDPMEHEPLSRKESRNTCRI